MSMEVGTETVMEPDTKLQMEMKLDMEMDGHGYRYGYGDGDGDGDGGGDNDLWIFERRFAVQFCMKIGLDIRC